MRVRGTSLVARTSLVAFAFAFAFDTRAFAQGSSSALPPLELFDERPFSNDTFVPVSRDAEQLLARGDRAWIEVSQRDPNAPVPAEALDRWREALTRVGETALVRAALGDERDEKLPWPPDPRGEREHRFLDVERAVLERLHAVDARSSGASRGFAEWDARFDALAANALAAAGANELALERVAREHPRTLSAARARVKLADLALERGELDAGRAALGLASADLGARDDARAIALREAIGRRCAAFAEPRSLDSPSVTHVSARFTRAERIELAPWSDGVRREEHTRVYAGFARSARGAWIVQTPRELVTLGNPGKRVEIAPLLEAARATPPDAFADRASDWVHAPGVDASSAVLVCGRTTDESDNALLAVDLASGKALWCWSGDGCWSASEPGAASDSKPLRANVLGAGRVEFEPGPLVLPDRVLVHVRCWPSPAAGQPAVISPARFESWVCALDLRSGAVISRTLLARGSSPVAALEKANLGLRVPTPQAPPTWFDDRRLWIDTGLGALAEIDPWSARVESLRLVTRIQKPAEYVGTAAGAFVSTYQGAVGPAWAPPDSPCVFPTMALWRSVPPSFAGVATDGRRAIGSTWDGVSAQLFLRPEGAGWELDGARGGSPVHSFDPGRAERPLPLAQFLNDGLIVSTERALYLLDPNTLAVRDRAVLESGCAGAIALEGPWSSPGTVWVAGERAVTGWTISD